MSITHYPNIFICIFISIESHSDIKLLSNFGLYVLLLLLEWEEFLNNLHVQYSVHVHTYTLHNTLRNVHNIPAWKHVNFPLNVSYMFFRFTTVFCFFLSSTSSLNESLIN